jgi:hypothetical protein
MSSQIKNHFEEYAQCCSELAQRAATPEGRQRLLKNGARLYARCRSYAALDQRGLVAAALRPEKIPKMLGPSVL